MFKRGRAQQQQNLFDPYQSFSPVVERMLKESWAGDFFENVFLAIDEQRFSVLYSEKYSRPNAPINLLISLLILKELNHLTDEELLESLAFDYRFHYALGIEDIEYERICINTLTNFRRRLLEHENQTGQDLLQEEIQSLSLHLADQLELDRTWARMDSMMIASACKKMSRLQLVYTVIRNAIKELDHLDEVPEGFQDFLSPSHEKETLYRTRTDEAQTRLECLWKHAIQLYTATSSMEAFVQTEAHAHLARLLREQTIETEEGRRLPIPGKENPSTGLQNPSDPAELP